MLDLQLQRHLDEELATNLRIAIRRRSDAVLKTTTMFACMYLDPRFQCMLNEAEKVIAKEHLTTLHRRITAADAIIERTLDQSMDDTLTIWTTLFNIHRSILSVMNLICKRICYETSVKKHKVFPQMVNLMLF